MSLNSAIKSRLVRCPRCCLMLPEPHNCMAYEGYKLLESQQRALALCFLVMEAGSVLLDMFGKNKPAFLLVAFLLSVLSFALTLYVSIKDRIRVQAEMKMMGIVFFLIQLVLTFLHFLLTVVDVKNNFNVSVNLLMFAMIAVVFILWKDKKVTDVPFVNPHTIDSMPSTSILFDLEQPNSLTMRCDAGTDVEQANRQVNDHDIPSYDVDKTLSNEEFRETIERFIAKQKRLLLTKKDNKNGGGSDDDDNGGGGDDDNNGGGDDGNNGSGGDKNEKKDGSDGNGNSNNDKRDGSGSGSGNNGIMKQKQMKPMFGCKFGYHAGNENLYLVGQLQCVGIMR